MLSYLRAEIYRVLRKKSLYIYFACFAVGYFLITLIVRDGDKDATGMLSDAENLFGMLPAIIGGYLFAALYTDDLSSRNLSTLIGFGLGKTKLVLAKLALTALVGGLMFAVLPLFMSGVYAVMGHVPDAETLRAVYAYALNAFMIAFACAALSAIVVYGLQKTTFGMVTYLLLSLGVVNQLLRLLLSWEVIRNLLPNLGDHLMFGISSRVLYGVLLGESALAPAGEYVIYIAVATALAALAFHKKELEF